MKRPTIKSRRAKLENEMNKNEEKYKNTVTSLPLPTIAYDEN